MVCPKQSISGQSNSDKASQLRLCLINSIQTSPLVHTLFSSDISKFGVNRHSGLHALTIYLPDLEDQFSDSRNMEFITNFFHN